MESSKVRSIIGHLKLIIDSNVEEVSAGGNGNSGNIFQQYSEEEIENFRCIFEMFDKERLGFIGVSDLQTIMRSLGRDPSEALDLMTSLNVQMGTNEDGSDVRINFEDFLKLMKSLENRLV